MSLAPDSAIINYTKGAAVASTSTPTPTPTPKGTHRPTAKPGI
jgi:hypothetical protein